MKKLNLLILLICLFLTGCTQEKTPLNSLDTIKSRDKIIIGIKDDSKPFGFIKDGKITGFDADIAQNISRKIFNSEENHIEFVPLKPSERIIALNTGKVDIVIATLSINHMENPTQIIIPTLIVTSIAFLSALFFAKILERHF